MPNIVINLDDQFENLPNAPIVEAVIDIRCRAEVALEETTLKTQLAEKLVDYQYLDAVHDFKVEQQVHLREELPEEPIIRRLGWKGIRFIASDDKKHIAHFNRDGFRFSRLEPYLSWDNLFEEGMRLWSIYVDIAQPSEIHRIGLRYINRIQLPPNELHFEKYLQPTVQPPMGLDLPFQGFLHQDTLAVPGYLYAINIIRTIQPPVSPTAQGMGLILDIDAFTTQGFALDPSLMEKRMLELRWLKNKVFFGSVTPEALKLFQ
jgi:uncharacterized protein (TIGR04255 family)